MQKIIDLGFTKAAEFHLNNGALECAIHRYADASRCLYVLIECPGDKTLDEDLNQIFYIGHTRRTFQRRMDDYKKGFKKQKQNHRVKDSISSRLSAGARVESWIWIDALSLQVRDLRVDVAAGLEYDLINYYRAHNQKHNHLPLLNVAGNVPMETIEIDAEEIPAPAIGHPPESAIAGRFFRITLGKTYWEYPVFNIPVEHQELFGESNDQIRIDFVSNNVLVRSLEESINRKANLNGTPRIYIHGSDGQWYREWLHQHFSMEEEVAVEIIARNHIRFVAQRP